MAGGVDATITAGSMPPPVFSPGESASMLLDIGDATINRYFSFASMIIPSNDLFIGNGDPLAHMLFDAGGNFTGPITIEIRGSDVYDAGTEVDDAFGGAAFSANGGTSMDEFNDIARYFDIDPTGDYLSSFIGSETASGDIISSAFGPDDVIARVTIVPAPSALAVLGLGLVAGRRRRRV